MNLAQEMQRGLKQRAQGRVRGRYAPSPTGDLHLGNIRAALYAWLHSRCLEGDCILRIEDLDQGRCKDGYEEQMLQDLQWLGFTFDEGVEEGGEFGPYRQSERITLYEQALELLKSQQRVYPCYCTRREMQARASRSASGEYVYDGRCKRLSAEELAELARTRRPAWRFCVDHGEVTIQDGFKGELVQDVSREVGDFVVRRRDGIFSYQLAVVVDDICMGVTDIVRGEDLYESSPRQVLLYRAFGTTAPRFWHIPLVLNQEGHKLSKRDRAHGVRGWVDEHGSHDQGRFFGALVEAMGWQCGESLTLEDIYHHACVSGMCDTWREAKGRLENK